MFDIWNISICHLLNKKENNKNRSVQVLFRVLAIPRQSQSEMYI